MLVTAVMALDLKYRSEAILLLLLRLAMMCLAACGAWQWLKQHKAILHFVVDEVNKFYPFYCYVGW